MGCSQLVKPMTRCILSRNLGGILIVSSKVAVE